MKLEAVTVCVQYDDFLQVSARYNRHLFDRWLVVTEPTDIRTRDVCRRFGLEVLTTRDNGSEFRKGRLIERGLQHLSAEGWRCHIDSDVVLPQHFRALLEAAELQTTNIYGADRIMIRSWAEWQRFLQSGYLWDGCHSYCNHVPFPKGFELGARWVDLGLGYVPIGFFQLWHSSEDQFKGIRNRPYPSAHNDACRTDVQFALQWDRPQRELLGEFVVAHLESEPAKLGVNWGGRKTRRFEAPK